MYNLAFVTPGPTDWIVILVIVLVLFGAKRIPELFKGLGQGMNEFRKAREEFDRELHGGSSAEAKKKAPEPEPVQIAQPVQTVTYAQPVQPAPQQPAQVVQPVQGQAGPVVQPAPQQYPEKQQPLP